MQTEEDFTKSDKLENVGDAKHKKRNEKRCEYHVQAEIETNSLDRYLTVISTLWRSSQF